MSEHPRTEAVLAAATNPDGSRRFYPPGEHPGTAPYRTFLANLERAGLGGGGFAAHLRRSVAAFEAGEDWAKLVYLRSVLVEHRERIASDPGTALDIEDDQVLGSQDGRERTRP